MLSRPRRGDTEEDILRMQEEFLREKEKNESLQPAARVLDMRSARGAPAAPTKRSSEPRPPSKYARAKGLGGRDEKRTRIENATGSLMGEILEKNLSEGQLKETHLEQNDSVNFPTVNSVVMGNIVEKNLNPAEVHRSSRFEQSMPSRGFPLVSKLNPGIVTGAMSIFAQQMNKEIHIKENPSNLMDLEKASTVSEPEQTLAAPGSNTKEVHSNVNIPSKSFIVTSGDADSIHKENAEVLNKMSEKEILEEQQKLLMNLDPEIIKFIKSRRSISTKFPIMDTSHIQSNLTSKLEQKVDITTDENMDTSDISSISNVSKQVMDALWESDVLSHPHIDKWMHFDSLEKDKLEWMKGIEESKKEKGDEEPYEARFDFTGYLLPYTIEYNEKTKTLFHHGSEPHRPGYSLVELFELTRSSIIQQRVVALNTIAGILEYYSTGIYKNIIDIPITKMFFIIRFALDENKAIILEPALRAMRNLLYNRVDEACLDALLGLEEGLLQPCLEHDKAEITELESKESELKDFHLAEIDLITGAIRTDILQRILYILEVVKPTFNCIQYCLQILSRLVRDSLETSSKIVQSDHLMNCIITNFLPEIGINFRFRPNIAYDGKPILAALKFIRILSLQSLEISEALLSKYNIAGPLCSYISSGVEGTYGLRIQMESFCILANLLHYGIGVETALSLSPILITSLYKHVNGTDITLNSSVISATHTAVLIQLINKLLSAHWNRTSNKYKAQVYPLIKQGFTKWISQLSNSEYYSCGHLRLLCSTLDCIKTIVHIEGTALADGGLGNVLKSFASSSGFKMLLKHLLSSSNLLSGIDNKMLHSTKNLTNLGGSIVDSKQKVLPILNFSSPLPFLASLVKLLDSFNDTAVITLVVNQFWFYLTKITTEVPNLSENWFTRIETDFLYYTLKIISTKDDLAESEKDLFYAAANKLCYILRSDKKGELDFLFKKIVFNKQWFTAERLMSLVSLTDANLFTKTLNSIDEIRMCYSKIININFIDTGPNVVLKNWQEPILPRDWIYLPVVKLYSEHQALEDNPEVKGEHAKKVLALKAEQKVSIVSCCLEWILFYELTFVNLLNDIDLTDRFCRIMCIFLCDNSLFLEPKIKLLLEKCVETIFQKEKMVQFNFDKDLIGLHNFQDFYTQFLEQFQAVSYGDSTFAACLLVPLAQKHNIKWRKLVWSEYAGCLRALDCPQDKLCYNINEYMYPEETDESLIKSYFHALSTNLLRRNTISFKIAAHHVNSFRHRQSVNSRE